jgi:hypothetical protein
MNSIAIYYMYQPFGHHEVDFTTYMEKNTKVKASPAHLIL